MIPCERNAPEGGSTYEELFREMQAAYGRQEMRAAERGREIAALRAELEAVRNERDLAVLTLAAFTPANKPNEGEKA